MHFIYFFWFLAICSYIQCWGTFTKHVSSCYPLCLRRFLYQPRLFFPLFLWLCLYVQFMLIRQRKKRATSCFVEKLKNILLSGVNNLCRTKWKLQIKKSRARWDKSANTLTTYNQTVNTSLRITVENSASLWVFSFFCCFFLGNREELPTQSGTLSTSVVNKTWRRLNKWIRLHFWTTGSDTDSLLSDQRHI